jgi:hypothetical protein
MDGSNIAGTAGLWTVVSGNAADVQIDDATLYNTEVTLINLTQTKTATLRWTVTNGTCEERDEVTITDQSCKLPVNRMPALRK